MNPVAVIILFVSMFMLGFCAGHMYQLKQNLAELKELQKGLDRIKELSAEADKCAAACIAGLERENRELKMQLAYYKLGGNVVNEIKLTKEES